MIHTIHDTGRKKSRRVYMVRGTVDKQTTSRPDYLWPEIWKDMSEGAQRKEKQKWAIEKPKLDNARRMRGIYFIDPADAQFKETIKKKKKARRKLEVPMPAAMLCKIRRGTYKETCRTLMLPKQNTHASLKPTNSVRIRMEGALHRYHEDHIAGKGTNSLNHYNLVHNFIPLPQIPDAKTAAGKNGKNSKIPAWQLAKVRNKNEVIAEARKEGKTVHFASLMDICHLKNSDMEPKFQQYEGRVVLRGDIVSIHRTMFICVTNDGRKSNGCHSKASRMRRPSSGRSISLHPDQNGRCTIAIEKFQSRNVQIFGYVCQNTNGQNHGPEWKTQLFLLSEICMVTF